MNILSLFNILELFINLNFIGKDMKKDYQTLLYLEAVEEIKGIFGEFDCSTIRNFVRREEYDSFLNRFKIKYRVSNFSENLKPEHLHRFKELSSK